MRHGESVLSRPSFIVRLGHVHPAEVVPHGSRRSRRQHPQIALGGIAYPTLVLVTLFVGFRALLVQTPWQPYLIAVFAAYLGSVTEGFIIGTEHWRHYYLLLGLVWRLAAATENARRTALLQNGVTALAPAGGNRRTALRRSPGLRRPVAGHGGA